jgi:hypothetical protein
MIKIRKISYLLLLTFLPMGCGKADVPPTAPLASEVKDTGTKFEPPKAVKKGRRIVQPGGAGTATP